MTRDMGHSRLQPSALLPHDPHTRPIGVLTMSHASFDRRRFLQGALAGGAALGFGLRTTWADDEPTGKPKALPAAI